MKIRIALLCALALCVLNANAQTPAAPATSQPAKPTQASPAANSSAAKTAAIDPAKEKDIRRLLEVAGTKDLMVGIMDGMEQNMRPILQNALPPGDYREKLIDAFIAKFRTKLDLNRLLDLAVPLYDQNYSDSEIKNLITFYETPLGQKVVRVTPAMTSEMMDRGRKMGEDLGRTSMLEVMAEHPEFEKAIEQAQQGGATPAAKPQ